MALYKKTDLPGQTGDPHPMLLLIDSNKTGKVAITKAPEAWLPCCEEESSSPCPHRDIATLLPPSDSVTQGRNPTTDWVRRKQQHRNISVFYCTFYVHYLYSALDKLSTKWLVWIWKLPSPLREQMYSCQVSPVQFHFQVREDELIFDEFPDDSGHLISLHLHHRTCLDLLRHFRTWEKGDQIVWINCPRLTCLVVISGLILKRGQDHFIGAVCTHIRMKELHS